MLTLYEIDQLAEIAGVDHYEILLSAYEQGWDLSPVCERLAGEIRTPARQ